jgi:hypothetical protein
VLAAVLFALAALFLVVALWLAAQQARLKEEQAARDKKLAELKRVALRDQAEFERKSALVVVVGLRVNEGDAEAANHVAKKVLIAEALGCVVFADHPKRDRPDPERAPHDEWQASLNLWQDLRSKLEKDEWFKGFFKAHQEDIDTMTSAPARVAAQERQAALVRVVVALREAIEEAGYLGHLAAMKKVWYAQVVKTSEQLADSASAPERFTLFEVAIQRHLFWRLQAQIVLVDSETSCRRENGDRLVGKKSKLNEELTKFGNALHTWEGLGDLAPAPEEVKGLLRDGAKKIKQACAAQGHASK